jgi:hypothetical protein
MKRAIPVMALLVITACSDLSDTELFDPAMAAEAWNTADRTWSIDELEILENGKVFTRAVVPVAISRQVQVQQPLVRQR